MSPAVAVVPVRGGGAGKTRLASVLGPHDRAALVTSLARHVVATLAAVDDVVEVVVVSASPGDARHAVAGVPGAVRVVEQAPGHPGLNAAVDQGRTAAAPHLARHGAGLRLLVAHGDLPALGPDDVHALLGAPGAVTLAADRAGTGTNALVVPAAAAFAFRFGPGSLLAHRSAAADLGWTAAVLRRPGTAVDLDTPEDWAALPAAVRRRVAVDVPALGRLAVPGPPGGPA